MKFEQALAEMRNGRKVTRPDMGTMSGSVSVGPWATIDVALLKQGDESGIRYPWEPTMEDVLAEDWEVTGGDK